MIRLLPILGLLAGCACECKCPPSAADAAAVDMARDAASAACDQTDRDACGGRPSLCLCTTAGDLKSCACQPGDR